MPAFSGLWDGVHGDGYAAMPKSDALPPMQRGIVRVLMQGRGMHGHVTALGRNAPATIARTNASRPDQTLRGTFDYAAWKVDPNDPARFVEDVPVDNLGGDVNTLGSIARPTDATETDMAHTYDTTLNNGHPADVAYTGVTSPQVDEAISDGT